MWFETIFFRFFGSFYERRRRAVKFFGLCRRPERSEGRGRGKFIVVDPTRFELVTFSLQMRCSSIELRAHVVLVRGKRFPLCKRGILPLNYWPKILVRGCKKRFLFQKCCNTSGERPRYFFFSNLPG